jgi:hypothetical protein
MMYEHESRQSCECGFCKVSHFERNNYFHGKMLSARDLAAEQRYFNEKRWLINRMIVGWGIVCGLEVCLENGCLVVRPGLALDCCGHELLICERQALHVNKIAEQLGEHDSSSYEAIPWALCLEYQECKMESVKPPSSCNSSCDQQESGPEYNRIRDHYRLSIRRRDDACPKDYTDFCCPYDGLGHGTSIHKALVERSRKCPECKECECVLLATGILEPNPGQAFQIRLEEDYWKYRRIVYTNRALADLIRCFQVELAHITEINWTPGYNYRVDDFLYLLTREHLKVTFDQPLNQRTVTDPQSFRLSVFIATDEGNCPTQLLIPVERVEYDGNVAVYYFDHGCIEHELRKTCKKLAKAAQVELVLHGSMVLDEHDRALDAELIGDFPTGNGVQGGEFITYFTVGP